MPTSTVPFEILFEFLNDTRESATLQVLRQEDGLRTGATVLMHRGENISLVLTAGSPYKYAVRQGTKDVTLSVKVWKETRCSLREIFRGSDSMSKSSDSPRVVVDGVAVISVTHIHIPANGHYTRYPRQ